MGGGAGFCAALSRWILENHSQNLHNVLVFVPTARVAARVRAHLAADMTGVLPAVLPLKGNGELADLLSLEMGKAVSPMAARLEIFQVLKRIEEDRTAEASAVGMAGERLWRRVDGVYKHLDRLALHGMGVKDLRRTVPEHLAGFWDIQAATLIAVGEHMERWLARRGEVLPCAQERRVLEQAAGLLAQADCPWVPVVAGVLDGVPAAVEVAKVAAARGAVIVPELGKVTAELAAEWEEIVGGGVVRLGVGHGTPVHLEVAATEWDEAWVAALAVRQAVEDGKKSVGMVSPSKILLERVSGLLEQWGMQVRVSGLLCMDRTPVGRAVLAVGSWGLKHGTPAHWLEAMRAGFQEVRVSGSQEGFESVMAALEHLAEVDVWLSAEDWRAVMGLVLGETEAPRGPVTDGVVLMGPLDARLLDFDTVIAAGAVEGVWPALHGDAWLSEAHLRALGMADSERKARLAGTEFESVVRGGSGEVVVTRARTMDGREVVASRFVGSQDLRVSGSQDLVGVLEALREKESEEVAGHRLGVFRPVGELWPRRWSASFIEAMLACPYKAMGERVLRLEAPDTLTPTPDARKAGLLAHRWMERGGKEFPEMTEAHAAQAVKRLLELAELELRHEPPVVRTVWRAKFAKLAPALVTQWLANGRKVEVVEKRLTQEVGAVTVTAKLDRVESMGSGAVVIDFKTSTPPGWGSVASGERPQLALEAWLLAAEGTAVADVEYWQLKGFGMAPIEVTRPGKKYPLEALLEPVAEGLDRLVAAHGEGAEFRAVPDMAGGGLMATGHCARCALAGVCRRKEQGTRNEERGGDA